MSQLYNLVRELIHPSRVCVCSLEHMSYLTSKVSAVKWQLSETPIITYFCPYCAINEIHMPHAVV